VQAETKTHEAERKLASDVMEAMDQDCGPIEAEPYSGWAIQLARIVLDLLDETAEIDRLREVLAEIGETGDRFGARMQGLAREALGWPPV
jgi:hypothetical protein